MPRADASSGEEPVVATLDLSFRDPTTDEFVEDSVTITYPHPAAVLQERGYFEAENLGSIHKSFVMLNIFVGIERVVVDYYSNRAGARTVAELDQLIAAVSDYNEEIADKDVELDLELLDRLRENLIRLGIPDSRAGVTRDPWPAD
jgi:hypothetical protein